MVRKVNLVFLTIFGGVSKMRQVNILEAKTDFSKLIRLLETKKEDDDKTVRQIGWMVFT